MIFASSTLIFSRNYPIGNLRRDAVFENIVDRTLSFEKFMLHWFYRITVLLRLKYKQKWIGALLSMCRKREQISKLIFRAVS